MTFSELKKKDIICIGDGRLIGRASDLVLEPGSGQIRLCWDERELRVLTDRPGGELIWQGQRFPLTAGQELRLSR